MKKKRKKPLLIEVTAEDIQHGLQCSKCLCPIGLAAGRFFGINANKGEEVSVDWLKSIPDDKIILCVDKVVRNQMDRTIYELPYAAKKFVKAFDDKGRKAVKPLTFILP